MTYEIVECTPSHIREIGPRLRAGDAREITCLGLSVRSVLWQTYRHGLMRRAVLVDGTIAAVWGVGGSALGGIGNPWLLTAPEIERIKVSFVREARAEIAEMTRVFPKLENYVAAEYVKACRFLELLGFSLDAPFPHGPNAALFRRFRMER